MERREVNDELTPLGQELERLALERGMTLEGLVQTMIAMGADEAQTRADIYWAEFLERRRPSEN